MSAVLLFVGPHLWDTFAIRGAERFPAPDD